jgi:hypothetical protein
MNLVNSAFPIVADPTFLTILAIEMTKHEYCRDKHTGGCTKNFQPSCINNPISASRFSDQR